MRLTSPTALSAFRDNTRKHAIIRFTHEWPPEESSQSERRPESYDSALAPPSAVKRVARHCWWPKWKTHFSSSRWDRFSFNHTWTNSVAMALDKGLAQFELTTVRRYFDFDFLFIMRTVQTNFSLVHIRISWWPGAVEKNGVIGETAVSPALFYALIVRKTFLCNSCSSARFAYCLYFVDYQQAPSRKNPGTGCSSRRVLAIFRFLNWKTPLCGDSLKIDMHQMYFCFAHDQTSVSLQSQTGVTCVIVYRYTKESITGVFIMYFV